VRFRYASAEADSVIEQETFSEDGDASATMINSGSISIDVTALATAAVDGGVIAGTATTFAYQANASASISSAIRQSADSNGGDATVSMDNSGSIDITAVASANSPGIATASASIESAISQSAESTGGDAFVTLDNSGSITISASADAVGDVYAYAAVHGGLRQSAFASAGTTGTTGGLGALALSTMNDASVSLINDGSFTLSADAFVSDTGVGPATATASASSAILQEATATGNAMADLTNTGTIDISAIANAVAASGSASANAYAYGNIVQDVNADGTGSAVIDNSGDITILAAAAATGSDALASATAYTAIGQYVSAAGEASGLIDNSGSIDVSAIATAVGTGGHPRHAAVGIDAGRANPVEPSRCIWRGRGQISQPRAVPVTRPLPIAPQIPADDGEIVAGAARTDGPLLSVPINRAVGRCSAGHRQIADQLFLCRADPFAVPQSADHQHHARPGRHLPVGVHQIVQGRHAAQL